ncbi:MAG TPA: hypothetical protein VD973_08555 [Symbiobacteriaceae bacterium]|nr:hypothetical protein [Symbiobacteriaceae bacterium]
MKRIAMAAVGVLLLAAGCANSPSPPSVPKETPSPPPAPPVVVTPAPTTPSPPATASVQREAVPNGFRVGPYRQILNLQWVGEDRVYGVLQGETEEALALIHLKEGMPQPLAAVPRDRSFYINEPVLDGTAVLFSGLAPGHWLKPLVGDAVQIADGSQWQVSPDRTRVVSYVKGKAGWFVDLRTGDSYQAEAPGFYGSNVWDAWSPDGARYLVQTQRTDPVPGFYLLDQSARRQSTWHEPGHYSLWAAWTPDSRQIAFLSVPMDTVYPKHPEAWAEPRLAPRLGVLDLASGKARYFSLPDKVLGAEPLLWSPDSSRIATLCGDLAIKEQVADMTAQRVCVADLKSGTITAITTEATGPQGRIVLNSWSSDGQSLVYGTFADPSSLPKYQIISASGGGAAPVPLPGNGVFWLSNDRLLLEDALGYGTLTMHDRQGKLLAELAQGTDIGWIAVSPGRTHLAYTISTGSQNAADPPSTYLVVVRTDQ